MKQAKIWWKSLHKHPVISEQHRMKANEQQKKSLCEIYLSNFLGFVYMYIHRHIYTYIL